MNLQMVQSDKYGDTLTYVDDAFLVELQEPACVAIDDEAALVPDVAQKVFAADLVILDGYKPFLGNISHKRGLAINGYIGRLL